MMIKRKQKIISFLFLLLLTAVAVCGCGTNADTEAALPQENTELAEAAGADTAEQPSTDAAEGQQDNTKASAATEPQPSAQQNTEKQDAATPAKQEPAAQSAPAATPAPGQEPACTISISCAALLNNLDACDAAKVDILPADGWILKPMKVTIKADETVFDVLQHTCKAQKIPLEFENTPMYNSAYIEGIYNLYEFDGGDLSGWMYNVNGKFPNYGCSQYKLQDGDVVNWVYTCDMGADVGNPTDAWQ